MLPNIFFRLEGEIYLSKIWVLCFSLSVVHALAQSPRHRAAVTYLANEGVLLEVEGRRILIDGLHRKYSIYAALPRETLEKLERAEAPFSEIDLILVSHQHGDHFHPESVGEYLKHGRATQLVSSGQIVASLEKDYRYFTDIRAQIKEQTPAWKKSLVVEETGLKVRFLGLRHSSQRFASIQNLGHLIETGGLTFLHVGDADLTRENFEPHHLAETGVDLAFLPYWFLLDSESRALVDELIAPQKIVVVHIEPENADSIARRVGEHYPDAHIFIRMLETIHPWEKGERP